MINMSVENIDQDSEGRAPAIELAEINQRDSGAFAEPCARLNGRRSRGCCLSWLVVKLSSNLCRAGRAAGYAAPASERHRYQMPAPAPAVSAGISCASRPDGYSRTCC